MLILTAILLATPASDRLNTAIGVCEREERACLAVVEAMEDREITAAELRDIQCRAELFTAQTTTQIPHCDTAAWNPSFEAYRAELCRAERIAARERLIGTAPTNEEAWAGIGENNPTPMCKETRR